MARRSGGSVKTSAVIKGEQELMNRLNSMAANLRKDISHDALMEVAKIVQRAAAAKAPGEVAQHIEIEIDTSTQVPRASIGPHKDYWQGVFVEFGVKPHKIETKKTTGRGRRRRAIDNAKKVLSDGNAIFGTKVNHPGVDKKPFMRPALDDHESEVRNKIGEVIARRLGAT